MNTTMRRSISQRPMPGALVRLAAAALFAAIQPAQARPGDLDASFGNNGHVRYTFSLAELASPEGPIAIAGGIVQQSDGKLVVGLALGKHIADGAYVLSESQTQDFSVLRFNSDGSPDPSFDADGRTGHDFPGIAGTTYRVMPQADGKIVAAGEGIILGRTTNFGSVALARYNADGSSDTSFAKGGADVFDLGWQITHPAYLTDAVYVVQRADGRLVVGTTITDSAPWDYGLTDPGNMAPARFTSDGRLDTTFGTNGEVVIDFSGAGLGDYMLGLGQQSDGKLVAAGVAESSTGRDFVVMRLSQDGTLDPTFDGDGKAVVSFGAGTNALYGGDVAIQPDGKILIAGTVAGGSLSRSGCYADIDAAVVRLNPDGSLDATFGTGGKVRVNVAACDYAQSLALEPGGAIIVGGVAATLRDANQGWLQDAFVARLKPSGELDPTYGTSGISIVDVGTGSTSPLASAVHLVRQADDKIVIVADVATDIGGLSYVVTRLLANGSYAGVLGLTASLVDTSEMAGSVGIPVRRTGGSSGTVSVDYATATTATGFAVSGADFTATAGTLTWADGDTADKTIPIGITADTQTEGVENFKLNLSNPSGGASLAASEIEIQILGDSSSAPPPTAGGTAGNPAKGGGGAIGCETLIVLAFALLTLIRRMPLRAHMTVHSGRYKSLPV